MITKILLVILILGSSLTFYMVMITSLNISWAMIIIMGGVIMLGILSGQKVLEKVMRLLSQINLGHILWFSLFIFSVWIVRYRDTTQLRQNPLDAAALIRILPAAITGIVVFGIGLFSKREINQLLRGLPGLMFLYGFIGIASAIYSPYRMLTIYKAFEVIVDIGLMAFFITRYPSLMDMKRWIDFNWFMVALLIAFTWIGAILFPGRAFMALPYDTKALVLPVQLGGVMPPINPNALGVLSALLSIVSLSRAFNATDRKERFMYAVSLLVGLVTLIFTQSRTSLIGGLLGIMTLLLMNKRIKILIVISLLSILLIVYTSFPTLLWKYAAHGQTSGKLRTLSGRTYMWNEAWEDFKKSPIYGYGFGAGIRYVTFERMGKGSTATIHNSWLEILVNVGIVGLIPVAVTFIGIWWTLLRTVFRPNTLPDPTLRMLSVEVIAVLVLISVRLITGGSSFMHDRETLLFLLIAAYAQQIRNWEKNRSETDYANSLDTQPVPIARP